MNGSNDSLKYFCYAILGYTSLVIAVHIDVVQNLERNILAGSQVGSIFSWEFWWIRFSLSQPDLLNPYFTPYLHFPVGVPFLTHTPLFHFFSYFFQFVADPFETVNLFYLLTYIGTGIGMYMLVYKLTRCPFSAFFSGFVLMFSHYNLTQHVLGHMGSGNLFFVTLIFLGLLRLREESSTKNWVLFFVGVMGSSLSTPYVAFSTLMIGVPLFFLTDRKKGLQLIKAARTNGVVWMGIGLCALLGFLAYYPIFVHSKNLAGGSAPHSLSLLSFVDFPAWHSWSVIQSIRSLTSGFIDQSLSSQPGYVGSPHLALKARPENLMGYFTLTVVVLLLIGIKRRIFKNQRFWVVLTMVGIVLSLGPRLQLAFEPTAIPLPYSIFEYIPILNSLRTPSRMILLAFLGTSVLTGIVVSSLIHKFKKPLLKWSFFLMLLVLYSFEMDPLSVGKVFHQLNITEPYNMIATDKDDVALLELPVAINKAGDVSINAQRYMLVQPYHKKPLVVGRPPRHLKNSLDFVKKTEFIYELTHPHVLKSLYDENHLSERRNGLIKSGPLILKENKIRYVLFHKDDPFFSFSVKNDVERFLRESLGSPISADKDGTLLFRSY